MALCKVGFVMDQSAEDLNCQTTLTSPTQCYQNLRRYLRTVQENVHFQPT